MHEWMHSPKTFSGKKAPDLDVPHEIIETQTWAEQSEPKGHELAWWTGQPFATKIDQETAW